MFLRRSSSTIYSVPCKTKTKGIGLKEYQNYVVLIDSRLKTKKKKKGGVALIVLLCIEHTIFKNIGSVVL